MLKKFYPFYHIIASLMLGLLIYLFLREGTFIHLAFKNILNFSKMNNPFTVFLKYYMVDALWGYALTWGFIAIWKPNTRYEHIIIAIISFLCAVVWELLQLFNYMPGSFDLYDIVMYLIAAFVAVEINFKNERDSKNE